MKAQLLSKQPDWFTRVQQQQQQPQKLKNGLTQDQEIQIGLEMIPMFKAKEEECLIQYERIQDVKKNLSQVTDEFGIKPKQLAKPLASTSFIVGKCTTKKINVQELVRRKQAKSALSIQVKSQ